MINEKLYKPSWIDNINHWFEKLPGAPWISYTACGLILVTVQFLFLLFEGGLQYRELLPIITFNGFLIPFLMALIYFLDNKAKTALNSMKPALGMTGAQVGEFQYKLSNMPARSPLIAGGILLLLVILMEQLWIAPFRYAALDQLPIFTIIFQIIDKVSAFLLGIFIYHTIRQLRLVTIINSNYLAVNLFNLRPSRAFSTLTAATAIGIIIAVYGWMFINPELLADPVSLGFVGFISLLAAVVFALPLYGVHKLIMQEKERRLQRLDTEFESIFSRFNKTLREADFSAAERFNGTIASLDIQRSRIAAIPTWPWQLETARSVSAAIFIPLLLSLLQYIIESF